MELVLARGKGSVVVVIIGKVRTSGGELVSGVLRGLKIVRIVRGIAIWRLVEVGNVRKEITVWNEVGRTLGAIVGRLVRVVKSLLVIGIVVVITRWRRRNTAGRVVEGLLRIIKTLGERSESSGEIGLFWVGAMPGINMDGCLKSPIGVTLEWEGVMALEKVLQEKDELVMVEVCVKKSKSTSFIVSVGGVSVLKEQIV